MSLLLASRQLGLDHNDIKVPPPELFLGHARTTDLLSLRRIQDGTARSLLRSDRTKILQAIRFNNVLIVHLAYGHGVAGERALQQVQLLKFQLDRVSTGDKQVIINIRPWLKAKYFVEDFKDIDVDLIGFLGAWLSSNTNVFMYPRLPDVLHDIDAPYQGGECSSLGDVLDGVQSPVRGQFTMMVAQATFHGYKSPQVSNAMYSTSGLEIVY